MLKHNHIHQERKVIHSVKRQWVILSAVTLLGTASITSINVNAASNVASNQTTSSLANTAAGYSNATATLSEAATNAINRLSNNIAVINSYAGIRTQLSEDKDSKTSAAINSLVANAQSQTSAAHSAYDQIQSANSIVNDANQPGGSLNDAAQAASQASAAFTGLMSNLASTDRIVGSMSSAVNQIENPSSSAVAVSSASTSSADQKSTTSSTATTKHPKSNATSSSTSATSKSDSNVSNDNSSSAMQTTKATSPGVIAAQKSIATAKRQVKLAKTDKAKAKAAALLKRAQTNLLIAQGNYNYKYYYYFDGPFDTVTTKKDLYVYSSRHLVKKYRIKKVPSGTTISVLKVLTDDNSSIFQVTGGNYITGKKSFFTK
ncbi:DUF5776 domain-containing protein [Lactobacillaceae bacterium Scapto_B20]